MSGVGVISWLVSDIKLLLLQDGVVGIFGLFLGPVADAGLGEGSRTRVVFGEMSGRGSSCFIGEWLFCVGHFLLWLLLESICVLEGSGP